MKEVQPSPLPWTKRIVDNDGRYSIVEIRAGGECVAEIWRVDARGEANADLIIAAVNAYLADQP